MLLGTFRTLWQRVVRRWEAGRDVLWSVGGEHVTLRRLLWLRLNFPLPLVERRAASYLSWLPCSNSSPVSTPRAV